MTLTGRLGYVCPLAARTTHGAATTPAAKAKILRLALPGPFDPEAAAPGLTALLARAGDVPDFARLDAYIGELQVKVRLSFDRILGRAR